MAENKFKTDLISELYQLFPGCIITHLDPNEIQGIPDLLILYGKHWAVLEGKDYPTAHRQKNQEYYVNLMNEMSFAAFIDPTNKEEVIHDLQRAFRD